MSATAHLLGGVLLDTEAPQFDEPVVADRNALLERALPAFAEGRLGPATKMEVAHSQGFVDARLSRRGREVIATGGEARFLAVVRALFSKNLQTSGFAVLAYREAELDTRLRSVCFGMVCGLAVTPDILGSLRTLLLVVEVSRETPT